MYKKALSLMNKRFSFNINRTFSFKLLNFRRIRKIEKVFGISKIGRQRFYLETFRNMSFCIFWTPCLCRSRWASMETVWRRSTLRTHLTPLCHDRPNTRLPFPSNGIGFLLLKTRSFYKIDFKIKSKSKLTSIDWQVDVMSAKQRNNVRSALKAHI